MSSLVRFEMAALLVNPLTAGAKYSRHISGILLQQIQIDLS